MLISLDKAGPEPTTYNIVLSSICPLEYLTTDLTYCPVDVDEYVSTQTGAFVVVVVVVVVVGRGVVVDVVVVDVVVVDVVVVVVLVVGNGVVVVVVVVADVGNGVYVS